MPMKSDSTHLGLDQDKINEKHDEIMLHVFIRETLTSRTLSQAYAFTQSIVIRFAVCCIESLHRKSASVPKSALLNRA